MRAHARARKGFTLIELLVVIAIIAILAALIFPAFSRAREATRQTTCIGQMRSISQALHIYYEDNHKYPPVLAAYGQAVDLSFATNRPLFSGKLIKDKEVFLCPDNINVKSTDLVSATYPATPGVQNAAIPNQFYKYDSYDVGPKLNASGNPVLPYVYELHYCPDWTGTTGPGDAKNQLKYPNAPDDSTVVTWCTYHVATAGSTTIPVLMLSGMVKPRRGHQFVTQGPLNFHF